MTVVEPPTPQVVLEIPKEVVEEVPVPPSMIEAAPSPPPAISPSVLDIPNGEMGIPLVAIAGAALAAFAAGTFAMRGRSEVQEDRTVIPAPSLNDPSSSTDTLSSVDVSIPYDAAARLEYDKWRAKFGKGGFDADKYAKFRATYDAVTSMNMAAKKVARDTGTLPRIQVLSADADS